MDKYVRQKYLWEQNTQKPRSIQKDNIKTILRDTQCDNVDQIHMSQDKVQWQAFIHHKVPHKP